MGGGGPHTLKRGVHKNCTPSNKQTRYGSSASVLACMADDWNHICPKTHWPGEGGGSRLYTVGPHGAHPCTGPPRHQCPLPTELAARPLPGLGGRAPHLGFLPVTVEYKQAASVTACQMVGKENNRSGWKGRGRQLL